jgi:glycosyltransferase involved in cell wall biosynthesis
VKILAWGNGSGSEYWRLALPFKYLNKMGHECYVTHQAIARKQLEWADIYVIQGIVDKEGLAMMYYCQEELGKHIIVDADDKLQVTKDNPHYQEHKVVNSNKIVRRMVEVAHGVTTTNEYLAEKLRKTNKNVEVLPNYMDFETWEFSPLKNETGCLRIGWCGSITHMLDLAIVEQPLKRILKEFPQVQLVIMGDPRYKEMFEGYNCEVMLGLPFEGYPNKLHGLCLDIGIAPLRNTDFNHCKSPIKYLEYSINHIPTVLSPTVYTEQLSRELDGKLAMVADTPDQWYQSIKNLIVCPELREDLTISAYSYVKSKFDLSRNAYKWEQAYKRVLTSTPESSK